MPFRCLAVAGLLALLPALAVAQPAGEFRLSYDADAAGMDVAEVQAVFTLGPTDYQVHLSYRTHGLAGLFYRGEEVENADGAWRGNQPAPWEYEAIGKWNGDRRVTVIDYHSGEPLVRALLPPIEADRQPVPAALRAHAIDRLTALALLIRDVARTGRCDASVSTYDGRRALEFTAHTVRWEALPHTGHSIFSGPALRCDFDSRVVAGLPLGEGGTDPKPQHGAIWFARLAPDTTPLPVQLQLETRWFGAATMYLTAARPAATPRVATH